MSAESSRFHESNLWSTPIRDLGLTIEGTRLEPLLAEFKEELRRVGLTRVRPSFYLSTEWEFRLRPWRSRSPSIWRAPS